MKLRKMHSFQTLRCVIIPASLPFGHRAARQSSHGIEILCGALKGRQGGGEGWGRYENGG